MFTLKLQLISSREETSECSILNFQIAEERESNINYLLLIIFRPIIETHTYSTLILLLASLAFEWQQFDDEK
jgi:hypothetical protein